MLARRVLKWTKRLLVGRPLRTERLGETLLPKKLALPEHSGDAFGAQRFDCVLERGSGSGR